MFLRVMADLDFHDTQYIFNDKHLSSIRIYNFVKKSMQNHMPGDIPWPITYLLTRFNRKHISTPPCKPNPDDVTNALDEFISQVKWAWFFRSDDKPMFKSRSFHAHEHPSVSKLLFMSW